MTKPKHEVEEEAPKAKPKAGHAALVEVQRAQQAAKEHDWLRVNQALDSAAKLLEGW